MHTFGSPVAVTLVLAGLLFNAVLAVNASSTIVITPAAIEQVRHDANTSVTVIDRSAIERSGASSVVELLRGQAGLQVGDLFGNGREAIVDLRGFGPTAISNTLILVDGYRLNNSADLSAPDLSLIDPNDIERIEILQGSAGVLYGDQAVGGVINVIRRPVTDDRSELAVTAGSYQSRRLSGTIERGIGHNRLSLSAARSTADNYRGHSASENEQVNLRLERQHAGLNASVELEWHDDYQQTPGALLGDELAISRTQSLPFYADDFFDTETRLLRASVGKAIGSDQSVIINLAQRVSERHFIQTFRPFAGSLTSQDRDTRTLAARYSVLPTSQGMLNSLLLGVERETTDYELLSSLGPQTIDQAISSAYLSTHWTLPNAIGFDAGLRCTQQDADIAANGFDDSVATASLGLSHQLNGLKLFVRADQNYRFPTVEEHTNVPFGETAGLQTQRGISYELGVEWLFAGSRLRLNAYQIDLDNEIAFDASGFANLNLDRTRRRGILIEANHRTSPGLQLGFSLTLQDAEIDDGPFTGNRVPSVPERIARVDLSKRLHQRLAVSMELVAVDDQVLGGDFANSLPPLESYRVVNAQLAYDRRNWRGRLRINNLFNESYSESGSLFSEFDPVTFAATEHAAFFPAPERNLSLTLEVEF